MSLTISLHKDKVLNIIKVNESLECFGKEMSSESESKSEIEEKHLHH